MTKCRRCTMRPPSLLRVQSKRARRPGTFDEVRATSIYLFESSCMCSKFLCRWIIVGEGVIGEDEQKRIPFASPSKDSKNICASFFDEKRAIIPRISLRTNLFPLRDTLNCLEFNNKVSNFSFFFEVLDVATFFASLTYV